MEMNRNALVIDAPAPVIAAYSPQAEIIKNALDILPRGLCPKNDSILERIPYIIPR